MALPRVENTIALHLIFTSCVGFGIFAFRVLVEPVKSWMLCNDQSINLPYKTETITTTHLLAYVFLIPPLFILIIEFLRWRLDEPDWFPVRTVTLFGWRVPKLVQCLYLSIGNFLYGIALTLLTVEYGKKTVGRLRPHFLDACRPSNLEQVCDPASVGQYIFDIVCRDKKAEITARESFPSAHSAITFYIATFLLFYLQSRMSWRSPVIPILRSTVQFIFFHVAFIIALTRIKDHYHHYSDVAAGAIIGVVGALIQVFFVSPLRWSSFGCPGCVTEVIPVTDDRSSSSRQSSVCQNTPNKQMVPKETVEKIEMR